MAGVNKKFSFWMWLLIPVILGSCTGDKKIYTSDCDNSVTFKPVTYAHLIDSLRYYDKKYIEISGGKYREGKEQSALFNDSLYMPAPSTALWVNFSQDCPLYLSGTRVGFFEYSNGGYTSINNKKVRIRGRLDLHNHGYLKQYKGCIDRVSFIEL
ncbi:hypothetical protein [Mucilaginibacter sp. UR6-11]|uniref:hypothetical protein n=1 Tax=Mucilaginibacter sp. UR6-11 TaxID=1435644 RepID=UPI001E3EB27A|nr:hypothetical protein [Mucilaginibacter sp. UR6-11]MCC8425594.1 hypothetical protein [Mucilaginibacter sp. UR6-11]